MTRRLGQKANPQHQFQATLTRVLQRSESLLAKNLPDDEPRTLRALDPGRRISSSICGRRVSRRNWGQIGIPQIGIKGIGVRVEFRGKRRRALHAHQTSLL